MDRFFATTHDMNLHGQEGLSAGQKGGFDIAEIHFDRMNKAWWIHCRSFSGSPRRRRFTYRT